MAITLALGVLDYDDIKNAFVATDNCTHPAGHCFGSDGGSGIPNNLKVPQGQGGNFEVWQLNATKTQIVEKYAVVKCQFCLKYLINEKIV